jgi:hypothetical protein
MHSTDNLDDGYVGSGKRLRHSVRKHGVDKHQCVILEYLPSREALALREAEIVNKDAITDPLCMNLALGGHGDWEHVNATRSPEEWATIQKLGYAAMISGLTADQRSARSKKMWKAPSKGLMDSAKIKAGLMTKAAATIEVNERRKATLKAMGHQVGIKNNAYGKCWVMNESHSIMIKREQLEEFLALGYVKGRTI